MNGIFNVELEDNTDITSKGNGNSEARAGAFKSDSSLNNILSQFAVFNMNLLQIRGAETWRSHTGLGETCVSKELSCRSDSTPPLRALWLPATVAEPAVRAERLPWMISTLGSASPTPSLSTLSQTSLAYLLAAEAMDNTIVQVNSDETCGNAPVAPFHHGSQKTFASPREASVVPA